MWSGGVAAAPPTTWPGQQTMEAEFFYVDSSDIETYGRHVGRVARRGRALLANAERKHRLRAALIEETLP